MLVLCVRSCPVVSIVQLDLFTYRIESFPNLTADCKYLGVTQLDHHPVVREVDHIICDVVLFDLWYCPVRFVVLF